MCIITTSTVCKGFKLIQVLAVLRLHLSCKRGKLRCGSVAGYRAQLLQQEAAVVEGNVQLVLQVVHAGLQVTHRIIFAAQV